MSVSDAQKRAVAKYQKEKTNLFQIRFYPADSDIYEHLCEQPNKAGYIKQLIRADMERNKQ